MLYVFSKWEEFRMSLANTSAAACCLFLGGLLLAGTASSQSAAAAESTATIPDFSALGWITNRNDFLPPKSGPGPVTFDPAHPYVMDGVPGKQPTFRVADTNNPILMPWVKDALKKLNDDVLAGRATNYSVANTCRPAGVPTILLVRITPMFFVQTPKQVWILWENDHQVRRIYLNQPHSKNVRPSWFGESVGHYEGDALVVDTIGISTKTNVDNYNTPHTEGLHVVERYHRVDGGKTLQVDVTVDDPGAFAMPWSATQTYRNTSEPMLEDACAETAVEPVDLGIPPIPVAEKPDF
jgi:hypothetical protein